MLEYGSPGERAEARMKAADAAIDAKALGALVKDMGLHEPANRDAALGLPTKRPITQYEDPANYEIERFDEMTGPHDGRTPGTTTPSRTDAASLVDLQARREACRTVERGAFRALLASGLTQFQATLLSAYHDSVYETRRADLHIVHAREAMANGGAE